MREVCGELYFIYLTTLGKGIIPYLPLEVRKLIYNEFYFKLICCYCNKLLVIWKQVPISYSKGYSIINGNSVCNSCYNLSLQNYRSLIPRPWS